jgi:hypothetical protein
LSYADLPARKGIIFERDGGCVRFIIPPSRWWRFAESIGITAIALFVLTQLLPSYLASRSRGFVIVAAFVVIGGIVAILQRLRRDPTIIIELGPERLRLHNISPVMSPDTTRIEQSLSYSRDRVYDIHYVDHSGNVIVRVRGEEMVEFRPSRDPRINRWIGEQMQAALAGEPAEQGV